LSNFGSAGLPTEQTGVVSCVQESKVTVLSGAHSTSSAATVVSVVRCPTGRCGHGKGGWFTCAFSILGYQMLVSPPLPHVRTPTNTCSLNVCKAARAVHTASYTWLKPSHPAWHNVHYRQ
ncbi:hypothetical protein BaRGS_00009513, partial [Batillaria attramentaria]